MNNKSKKGILGKCMKWFLFALLIVVLLFIILASCDSNSEDANNETTSVPETQQTENPIAPNTSAMVDDIARKAKAAAQTIDETSTKEAIEYIKSIHPNYFVDNKTMEQTMYYGYLLEYAYTNVNEDYANLGMDISQAIKYVYRGAEKVEDSGTQENLKQIEESLNKIK